MPIRSATNEASWNPSWGFFDSVPVEHIAMENPEEARRRAEEEYRRNQQTQMATEQAIRDADARNAYNAELDRQRRQSEQR